MTSLATAVGGMNHWDWCPICRGGLDTGLECDQCGADMMPIYTAFKESLSGGNPGEPKACTPAEERGIVGATGAGQLPDGKPGSTVDSAERRSPDGTERTPSPDESNRHLSSKSTVWMAKNRAYSETCYFGHYATAVAWARGGTVVPVEVQHYTPPALHVPKTDLLAEAVRMIQGYQRAGWLTNPAAGEQASDFIARASHEPAEATGGTATVRTGAKIAELVNKYPGLGIDTFVHERDYNQAENHRRELKRQLERSAPIEPQGWQPIETAPKGLNVLVAYQNKLGKWRMVRACYYEAGTLMTDDSVEEPYCDENGYAHPGWYEECESQEYINPCDEEPTLWHPLPSAPSTKLGS